MTRNVEDQLRDFFLHEVSEVTADPHLGLAARRSGRRRRGGQALIATVGGIAAAMLILGGIGVVQNEDIPTNASGSSGSSPGGGTSCAVAYSPEAVTQRAFAFAGSVVSIDQSATFDFERSVTFRIDRWFRGEELLVQARSLAPEEAEATAMVNMPAPNDGNETTAGDGLDFSVGDSLLVSGELRVSEGGAAAGPVAWSCGFTTKYDTATADSWLQAFEGAGGS